MKKVLGLDLGTNSIGWALVEQDFSEKTGSILGIGSRIIPMSQDIIGEFGKGNSISQTAERTRYRGIRRLRERYLLRRERLHRVLNILSFLPEHYANLIDFENRKGQFLDGAEPKLAYCNNEFIFKDSFKEMLTEFKRFQPRLVDNSKKIPYDWTLYYLRKKSLTEKISKSELAWIILNFNQKRGYYQLRGEEEEESHNKLIEFHSLKVIDVIPDEAPNRKGDLWYSIVLENGWIYRRSSKTPLDDWKDKIKDFIVTTDLNEDGTIKTDSEGAEKRSFRAPKEDDWNLVKKKTEYEIINSEKTVGEYIYEAILRNPNQKIRGKLIRTIERKFYKEELIQILNSQKRFHPELNDKSLLSECISELYRFNEPHQLLLLKKDFVHLIVNDIIFYQRPLKSKKSCISNCSFEYRKFRDENGVEVTKYLKSAAKSIPYYQEFRLWQWIHNLRLLNREGDVDVTYDYLQTSEEISMLFDYLSERKEIDQKTLLKYFKLNEKRFRWNYVEDKSYPCFETRALIKSRLKKVVTDVDVFLTSEKELLIWHIIYSVTDIKEFEKVLKTFAVKFDLDVESFVDKFRNIPPFKSDYGTLSEKAIKKILPLLRTGKYWNWQSIPKVAQDRILRLINAEYDNGISDRLREKLASLQTEKDFQGLQMWLAQYLVYGETKNTNKWESVSDIDNFLAEFKQHTLRNPIVEQVVTETLRVVRDIWAKFGKGNKNFFNEIHVELGREMKNSAEDRKSITKSVTENENTNLRIKALLAELFNDSNVENVRPYSPIQQEALKIYEDGVLRSIELIPDDILKISKSAQPNRSELQRYKLWLEQKYRSPYTGQIIPLNKLFTTAYEIEHVIPQSKYFDDSFSNKVICESAVNKLKDNQLGLEFIKNHQGEKVEIGSGKFVEIFSESGYRNFIAENYEKNPAKRNKLLFEEVPEKMIERQLNDTRYISKYISALLSNIVRSETNDDGINSKNLHPGNGKVTNILKKDWGLHDVWNVLILPRFERMNEITNSTAFTVWNEKYQKYLPSVPLEFSKGFQKKRIDHRHHAMDALVIACATRDHINLLNNKFARSKNTRYDLQHKLRHIERKQFTNPTTGKIYVRDIPGDFIKPWPTFTQDVKAALEKMVISFKQNHRLINKTSNKYQKYINRNGQMVKEIVPQVKGDSWAIRKSLHKETVSGLVKLDRIKLPKGKILTATRKSIDQSFTEKVIRSITDTGIQKILLNYLKSKGGKPELAFSPEGLEDMNNNIEQYNNGKKHKPIHKARIYESGSKFALGETGNKRSKYVEAAKGTNLFFAIYQDESGKRSFETIPLNVVIERLKQGWGAVPETNEKGHKLLFHLSPNDLVFIPGSMRMNLDLNYPKSILDAKNPELMYKVVSFSGTQCFFVQINVASSIVNKMEFSALNKLERSIAGDMIKDVCVKLLVDRIGNVHSAIS